MTSLDLDQRRDSGIFWTSEDYCRLLKVRAPRDLPEIEQPSTVAFGGLAGFGVEIRPGARARKRYVVTGQLSEPPGPNYLTVQFYGHIQVKPVRLVIDARWLWLAVANCNFAEADLDDLLDSFSELADRRERITAIAVLYAWYETQHHRELIDRQYPVGANDLRRCVRRGTAVSCRPVLHGFLRQPELPASGPEVPMDGNR